jgi:arginase
MTRPTVLVGAPSSIGIRPYDNGSIRGLHEAPCVLRDQGIKSLIPASDLGDVVPPAYVDFERPPGRARNEEGVAAYSRKVAERVSPAINDRAFVLLLGGDCSIVLGALLGARKGTRSSVGLIYVDAHADFATPEESRTGSVASMCLALAVGRGDTPLARLAGQEPLVRGSDVVIIGRRDDAEPWYGQQALSQMGILDLNHKTFRRRGPADIAREALARVAGSHLAGFWVHLDADVIDPSDISAVDSPEPDGLRLEELALLLTPLVRHPRALGLQLTIYDPQLDANRTSASRLAGLLGRVLGNNCS